MKDKIKRAFHASSFRYGTFSIILSVVVIAIVVAINLIVANLPSSMTSIDISESQLYSIGDTTKELVSEITEDVYIYMIASEDDLDETINLMLAKYEDLSDYIHISHVDPDTDPTFLTTYDLSSDDLSGYTDVLVVSEKRQKLIDYLDIYEINYTSYYSYSVDFDGEGEVTSAISYVTTDVLPKMYVLQGHGEDDLSDDAITKLISKNNIETETLNLLTEGSVPDDCDILAIITPQEDFTEEEVDAIEEYIAYGGNCVIVNYADAQADMPNYEALLAYYGVEIASGGCIFETSGYSLSSARWYIYEPVSTDHDITSSFTSASYLLSTYAQPIYQLDDMRSTLTITSLLSTSDGAWFRDLSDMDQYTSLEEKIDSDVDGPFDLAVLITDSSDEGEGQIVLFSLYDLLSYEDTYNVANGELFINAVSYLCSLEVSIDIDVKTTSISYNTATTSQLRTSIMVFEIAIPLIVLGYGFVIWFRRRSR